jgi:glycosyltransferase involved in cell wall biosynthesis
MLAVPLRIGGGSRLKILEAIAAGVPVVSTRVGCEGLAFRADHDIVVADSPQQMTEALVDCMRNPERAAAMVERGRELIERKYDWSRLAANLEQLWIKHGSRSRKRPAARQRG